MKRSAMVMALVLAGAIGAQGCYGSYSGFRAVHRWNGHATGSKVANSVIHFGLWIIPVYELVLAGDFIIFNTVEFVTDKPVFQ